MYKIIFALSIYTLSYIGTYTRSAFEYLADKNSVYTLLAYKFSKSDNANSKLLTLCYNDVISIHCVNSSQNVHCNFQFSIRKSAFYPSFLLQRRKVIKLRTKCALQFSIFNFQFARAHSILRFFSNVEK